MARFVKFYQNLIDCDSLEISVLAKIVRHDVRSTTARNLALVSKETGVQVECLSSRKVRALVKTEPTPVNQEWRGPLLQKLLNERRQMKEQLERTDEINKVIDSLCSSYLILYCRYLGSHTKPSVV